MSLESAVGWVSVAVFFGGSELRRHGYQIGCWMGAVGFLGMIASMVIWAVEHVRVV